MLSPRWRKVARDLWGNRSRTALTALAIAVGVFAVGAIAGAGTALDRGLAAGYAAVNPADAQLLTAPFDDALVQVVRRMPGVADAEGRRSAAVRLQTGPDVWVDLTLFALPDDGATRIGVVRPERGAWPPPTRAVLLERASLAYLGLATGDRVRIRTPAGVTRELPIAGAVHDVAQMPPVFDGTVYAYVSLDTLEWLGEPRSLNELRIVAAPVVRAGGRPAIQQLAAAVEERVTRSGRDVLTVWVNEPGRHPLGFAIDAIVQILAALSVLAVALSCLLVLTTITALLAQQRRQIGVMKAIGARTPQIFRLYLATVLVFGGLALLVALPLSGLGASLLADFLAGLMNFDPLAQRIPAGVRGLQLAVGLLVPALAALPPILAESRRTIRETLSDAGPAPGPTSTGGRLRRLLGGLPRPLVLALRNTFRRRLRLGLTLLTLSLAGAIFVGVLNLRAALLVTLEDILAFNAFDVWVTLAEPQRLAKLEQVAAQTPGVAAVEGWGFTYTRRVRPDGGEGAVVAAFFPPAESALVRPQLLEGRWLVPDDDRALVVSSALLRDEPDLRVGGQLTLKIGGADEVWTVVGVAQLLGPFAYAPYASYARLSGEAGRARVMMVRLAAPDAAGRAEQLRALEQRLDGAGLGVASVVAMDAERSEAGAVFGLLTGLLLVMAGLLAVVGGLGLASTMSLNVLERTREIGVMRAIGAGTGAIFQVVVAEGLVIGLLSWLLGVAAATALSAPASQVVGAAFLGAPLHVAYAPEGVVLWLAAMLLLAVAASLGPAWRATRLTIRAVLAYE